MRKLNNNEHKLYAIWKCLHASGIYWYLFEKKKHIFQFAIASIEINIRNGVLDTSSASFFFFKCYLQQIVVTQSIIAATCFISFEYIPITLLSCLKFDSEQANHNFSSIHWIICFPLKSNINVEWNCCNCRSCFQSYTF